MANRSSGLDFSDRPSALDQHPDLPNPYSNGHEPSHLQRNKTERRRLQGLQRSLTNTSIPKLAFEPKGWKQKWDVWMINDGGKQLFFAIFIFLHLLVAVFGFLNYQLRDNSVNARATFGITFRE